MFVGHSSKQAPGFSKQPPASCPPPGQPSAVERQTHQVPLGFDFLQPAQSKADKAHHVFDDPEGWKAYSVHPAHDAVRDVLRVFVRDQSVVQFWAEDHVK